MTEFNLSDKIEWGCIEDKAVNGIDVLLLNDVKEFIRLLKIAIQKRMRDDEVGCLHDCINLYDEIDKLVGEKLTQ